MRSIAFGILTLVTMAAAQLVPDAPRRATQVRGEFVNAYEPCVTPNTATNPPVPIPACTAVLSSPACAFTRRGRGMLGSKVRENDIELKVRLSGLGGGLG